MLGLGGPSVPKPAYDSNYLECRLLILDGFSPVATKLKL